MAAPSAGNSRVPPLEPDEILRRVQASGLRGRGGGWYPAGRKWQAVRAESGDPIVIANGAEGEPGSIKDRFVMARRPADVLAGLTAAARAVGAREAIVYLKASFEAAAVTIEAAREALPADGLRIEVRLGDSSYIGGEETAILESLEGRRPWPRPKPPLPAAVGLYGRPTLVQNVETLARVPAAVQDPAAFRAHEATLVSLWGDVRRPGVYEVPLGLPISQVIRDFGDGTASGLGMIFPAGPSAAPLDPALADTPLDPDALRAVGSALGTASVLVVGASRCPLSVAASLASFFERESCGQCPPCTVGTASLARVLSAVESGDARGKDLAGLDEAAGFMAMHGYCAHCRTAAFSARGIVGRFRAELLAHLAAGGCPRPEGRFRPFDVSSPERLAIEALAEAFFVPTDTAAGAAQPSETRPS